MPPSAQDAILAATERLLEDRRLSELSVAEIIAAAGISRTSFYAYFSSKTAVIAEALRRVTDQVIVAVEPFLSAGAGSDPEAAIRASLERWVEVCTVHGALMRTVSEEWPHDAQLRTLWSEILATFAAGTAGMIRAAREGGQAPPGADADTLAACLMWGYERVLHLALVGEARGLPEPAAIVDPLAQMMLGSVFGRAV